MDKRLEEKLALEVESCAFEEEAYQVLLKTEALLEAGRKIEEVCEKLSEKVFVAHETS